MDVMSAFADMALFSFQMQVSEIGSPVHVSKVYVQDRRTRYIGERRQFDKDHLISCGIVSLGVLGLP